MSEEYLFDHSEFHSPQLVLKDEEKKKKILDITQAFRLSKDKLIKGKNIFLNELNAGLLDGTIVATEKCSLYIINTYITKFPNGSEEGNFLSLDLGSTNFRVCLTRLKRDKDDEFMVKYFDVPDKLRWGKSVELFDHLAACLDEFLAEYPDLRGQPYPVGLGFTFSYPMKQLSINCGILLTWTKSYDIKDAIGQNAAKLLQDAIDQKKLNVKVAAIINDSSGTLIKGIYLDPDCYISCIMGSGFNCCYVEKANRVPDLALNCCRTDTSVLINLEAGAFGDNGCIDFLKTDIDFDIDRESLFPHSFSFEKLFSGVFLKNIVVRLMLKLAKEGLMFDHKIIETLNASTNFRSLTISHIEADCDGSETKKIIHNQLGYSKASDDDVTILRYLCALVSVRAASLIAMILAGLLEREDKKMVKIAIDGSMYKKHPKLKQLLTDFITCLAPGKKFDHFLAEDGSGKGAGLVVASLYRDRNMVDNK